MEERALRIVQISDMHIFEKQHQTLLGVPTYESLKAVIDLLKKESHRPDAIILSGDLSQDRSEASYLAIAHLLKTFSIPVYYVFGNHDDFETIARVYPRDPISDEKHILFDGWQLILLNSQKKAAVEGYLDLTQLDFLKNCLTQYPI